MSTFEPFEPFDYPPECAAILRDIPVAPLGPGSPIAEARGRLADLDDHRLFGPYQVHNRAYADCCRSGLWLAFHFLDESHSLSQSIETPSGSMWHGILHRREPDASNAKYWFRRAGSHPVVSQLTLECQVMNYPYTTPLSFVDFCEAVRGSQSADEEVAQKVQWLEWRLLFDWCYRQAIAAVLVG